MMVWWAIICAVVGIGHVSGNFHLLQQKEVNLNPHTLLTNSTTVEVGAKRGKLINEKQSTSKKAGQVAILKLDVNHLEGSFSAAVPIGTVGGGLNKVYSKYSETKKKKKTKTKSKPLKSNTKFKVSFDTGVATSWISLERLMGKEPLMRSRQSTKIKYKTAYADWAQISYYTPPRSDNTYRREFQDKMRQSRRKEFDKGITLSGSDATSASVTLGVIDVAEVPFGVVNQVYLDKSADQGNSLTLNVDGVVGLGFEDTTSLALRMTPPMTQAIKQGAFKKNVVSFYFSQVESERHLGQISFGDIDHGLYEGKLTTVDIVSPNTWVVKLNCDQVSYGDTGISLKGGHNMALVDSGTHHIYAPAFVLEAIYYQVPISVGAYHVWDEYLQSRVLQVPCVNRKLMQPIGLTLGALGVEVGTDIEDCAGSWFSLSPFEYFVEGEDINDKGQAMCRSIVVPSTNMKYPWILGYPFLSLHYTVFDFEKKQVLIAKAKKMKVEEWWKGDEVEDGGDVVVVDLCC